MSQGNGEDVNSEKNVVNFDEMRSKKLDEKRRQNERTLFKQLLSVYTVAGDDMRPIEFVDVSEDGFSFRTPFDKNNPWPQNLDEFVVRMYFSQDTYLPVVAKVQNSSHLIDDGVRYIRVGCSVDNTTRSYAAYQQFVKFMHAYTVQAHHHDGSTTLFYV